MKNSYNPSSQSSSLSYQRYFITTNITNTDNDKLIDDTIHQYFKNDDIDKALEYYYYNTDSIKRLDIKRITSIMYGLMLGLSR